MGQVCLYGQWNRVSFYERVEFNDVSPEERGDVRRMMNEAKYYGEMLIRREGC